MSDALPPTPIADAACFVLSPEHGSVRFRAVPLATAQDLERQLRRTKQFLREANRGADVNAQVNGPNGAGGSIGYDVTNMEKAGEMAKGKDFFLEGIDVIPQPTAAAEADRLADLTKLLNSGRLVLLDSDQKEIFSVFPLRRVVSDLTFSGIDTTHGNADERDPFMLANPINIEEGQRFTVNIDFPGVAPVLTADTYLTVVLLGQEHKAAISQ